MNAREAVASSLDDLQSLLEGSADTSERVYNDERQHIKDIVDPQLRQLQQMADAASRPAEKFKDLLKGMMRLLGNRAGGADGAAFGEAEDGDDVDASD